MVVLSAALALTCALDVVLATTCDEGGIVTVTEDILLTVNDITKKVVDQDLAKISKDCKTPLHDFVGAGECATAAQAAVGLNLAFEAFNITSMEQAATVIGQMIAESGGFQMGRNHYGERQDGKDCSDGCALGQFGKGTYAMWPSDSLSIYAVSEGIMTQEQAASLSGEEVLALINGPENPHAYGPDVWFLSKGKPLFRSDWDACPEDFAEQLDKGNLDPYKKCLSRTEDPAAAGAVFPDNYISTLFKGMKDQNCQVWKPSSPVIVEYPAGVVSINEATNSVSPPISQPSMTTSVASDWVYSEFDSPEVHASTVTAIGGNSAVKGDGNVNDDSQEGQDNTSGGASGAPASAAVPGNSSGGGESEGKETFSGGHGGSTKPTSALVTGSGTEVRTDGSSSPLEASASNQPDNSSASDLWTGLVTVRCGMVATVVTASLLSL